MNERAGSEHSSLTAARPQSSGTRASSAVRAYRHVTCPCPDLHGAFCGLLSKALSRRTRYVSPVYYLEHSRNDTHLHRMTCRHNRAVHRVGQPRPEASLGPSTLSPRRLRPGANPPSRSGTATGRTNRAGSVGATAQMGPGTSPTKRPEAEDDEPCSSISDCKFRAAYLVLLFLVGTRAPQCTKTPQSVVLYARLSRLCVSIPA